MDNLTREVDLTYICRVCRKIFRKHYNVAKIIGQRLKKGRYLDLEDLTVAGLGLPRIKYCSPECRRDR